MAASRHVAEEAAAGAAVIVRLSLGFVLAFLLSLWSIPQARRAALAFGVVDAPDGNLKRQAEPVPYFGGLAVFAAFLLAYGMIFDLNAAVLALLLASSIVAMVGLIDDFGVLTPLAKVMGQLIAVFVLLRAGISVHVAILPWWVRIVVTVLWLVGLSNAVNLIDIMDGLAGSIGVIAAIFLLAVAVVDERWVVAALTAVLIGALLGFLRFNFAPAQIYFGDCGSLFLGMTLGALAMVMSYTQSNPLGWLAPVYILAIPLIDTVYVSVLRIRAGKKIYYGSPDHFPLRLRRRLGGSTAVTVVLIDLAAVVLGGCGLLVMWLSPAATLWLTAGVATAVVGMLVWLARVPMETG